MDSTSCRVEDQMNSSKKTNFQLLFHNSISLEPRFVVEIQGFEDKSLRIVGLNKIIITPQ